LALLWLKRLGFGLAIVLAATKWLRLAMAGGLTSARLLLGFG